MVGLAFLPIRIEEFIVRVGVCLCSVVISAATKCWVKSSTYKEESPKFKSLVGIKVISDLYSDVNNDKTEDIL